MRTTLAVAVAALALLGSIGCGDDESPQPPTITVSLPQQPADSTATSTVPAPTASGEADGTGPAETATTDPRTNALERSAARTVRHYIEALTARDGATVCALLAPGAIDTVELPVQRGSCAASLNASLGYADPRGFPVWEKTEINQLRRVEIGGDSARVVADVITTYSDRDEPSLEDDIVYLTRDGPRWLIAKPSSTLYRAVGIADVPVAVLSPPD